MSDFNATLKRAFAEAPEPADDGFSLRLATAVARQEKNALRLATFQGVAMAIAAAAIAWGLLSVFGAFGQQVLAGLGLEIARAHGAVAESAPFNLASLAIGMTQLLAVAAGLVGGAVAYRATQQ